MNNINSSSPLDNNHNQNGTDYLIETADEEIVPQPWERLQMTEEEYNEYKVLKKYADYLQKIRTGEIVPKGMGWDRKPDYVNRNRRNRCDWCEVIQ